MPRPLLLALAALLCAAPAAHGRGAVEQLVVEDEAPARAFPVEGKVDYGGYANRFGGGRGHDGHDVFADCGTPLVAAAAGRVVEAKYHGASGNYVVIRTAEGRDHVYAHLRLPAAVSRGERVQAGQRLGSVGDTGNAWDCHLHFEVWTAPGWYRGGHPIDPLPFLRSLRD